MIEPRTGRVELIDKIVAILNSFSDEEALTPFDLASMTDLPLSTVYRLTQALESHGWLMRQEKHYTLGLSLMHLGALVAERIDLRQRIAPFLYWLNEQTDENAELQVRKDDARMILEVVTSSQNLRPIVHIGQPIPVHRGAGARILLAWLPREEQITIARASATRFPNLPLEPADTLYASLAKARDQGYYASDSERFPNIGSIAAPIFDAKECVVGAMTLTAPSVRLTASQRRTYIPLVMQAAENASRALGYTGSFPGVGEQVAGEKLG